MDYGGFAVRFDPSVGGGTAGPPKHTPRWYQVFQQAWQRSPTTKALRHQGIAAVLLLLRNTLVDRQQGHTMNSDHRLCRPITGLIG